ncbi:MAG: SurA N-terminal domain-containing protein [Candidatus Accumulibacter sp.]|jgi:peptidyl-prolyl cis-trans isomerase D|nr:SurA N-terminal domain-containing protein [Accumulibacter sp.]
MFDAVRNNKRIVQIFLALITLPFAFWGIDSYMGRLGAGSDLASVGESKISYYQFEQALRERQDQMREALGSAFRPEMMNSPEVRMAILNGLINQRLLTLEAAKNRLTTVNHIVQEYIASRPYFQENGQFSKPRYEAVLKAQGRTMDQFEALLRQDMTTAQLVGAIESSAFVASAQAEALLRIQAEERAFSEFKIAAAPFAEKIEVKPDDVRKFYDDNKPRFETPERVKAEYAVLSVEALMPRVTVSEAEIEAWYKSHKEDRYTTEVADEASKQKAKAKAEEILKEARQDPARFAELAKQHSKDPGSAEKGGDLGFFGRGMMVKPFEDAVFGLKEGEISDLVETDFGYHIITLTGVRGDPEERRASHILIAPEEKTAKARPLAEVRGEIENELRRQTAARQFAEAAETFNNMVYEQPDSLQPAAEKFGLEIERSDWLPKNAGPQERAALGALDNDRLLAALFSDDAVKQKRNTEVIETAPNTLVAARVAEYAPAALRPFETVQADIEKTLRDEEAMKQAEAQGEARLAELRKGEDAIAWPAERAATRLHAVESGQPPAVLQALFKADAQKLPAYVGVPVEDGYALFKIVRVTPPEKIDEAQLKSLREDYASLMAQEDAAAYISSLRARYKIDINQSLLESREK